MDLFIIVKKFIGNIVISVIFMILVDDNIKYFLEEHVIILDYFYYNFIQYCFKEIFIIKMKF